jgi:IPT/TIG domain
MKAKRFWMLLLALLALGALLTGLGCEGDDDDDDDDDDNDDNDDDEFSVLSVQPGTGPVAGGTAVVVYGRGFEDGCTLYFGDSEATDMTFTSATELSAVTPASPTAGNGAVTVKVENPGGEFAELQSGFFYGEPGVEVGWCAIRWPESTQTAPGVASEPIYGHVYVEGCTEEQGAACDSLTVELGWGSEGVDPSVDPDSFGWVEAAYNPDFYPPEDDEAYNNDEFVTTITEDDEGVYKYAYRVSGDGGASWTYCDWGVGADDGFSPSALGTLTVAEVSYTIGWCVLQYPASTQTPAGVATEGIFGRVFVEGCTDGDAFCGGITGELGWGPRSVNPSTDPGSFDWTGAAYNNEHVEDNNDEYGATIIEDTEGDYAYAYRFSGDGGTNWTYCDLDGAANGFQGDQMGALSVGDVVSEVSWCTIQWPAETTVVLTNATEALYGRVFVAGVSGAGGSGRITAEVGYAASGSDPTGSPGDYDWTASTFSGSFGNNDEYQTTVTPGALGDKVFAYRFAVDGGAWTYCDFQPEAGDGFQPENQGVIHVVDSITAPIGWCTIQHPQQTTTTVGAATELIYGRVFVDGYTGTGEDSGIIQAQLGYAPQGQDPSATPGDFTWVAAAFNDSYAANDEYQTSITPDATGTFGFAYRFSTDGGASWTYCDYQPEADDGFQLANMGVLLVNEAN